MSSWANSGVDLHLAIDRSGRRLSVSLETELRAAIRSGRLPPGSPLPPTRSLAVDLGIARNTVAEVYARLIDEGWLVAQQGAGTTVADGPHLGVDTRSDEVPRSDDVPRFDLRAGFPDVSAFPAQEWTAATRAVLAGPLDDRLLGYPPPGGAPELRAELVRYLGRVRGVSARSDRTVVTAGFTDGLGIVAAALREHGVTRVGVESHGHAAHRDLLRRAGLQVRTLPVDDQGAVPEHVEGLGAVLLTPAHQFPLGVALSAARRSAFVQWARAAGAMIVEDDYDGEFRYDRRAIGALQALAPDRVIYAGTTSKTLAPGVRLGWLVLPREFDVEHLVTPGDGPSTLSQAVLAQLIRSGRYDRHVRRMRTRYRRRRRDLVAAVGRYRGVSVTGLDAGLHAVLRLFGVRTERRVVARCHRLDVAVAGLHDFAAPGVDRSFEAVVVGYAASPGVSYSIALGRLVAALA